MTTFIESASEMLATENEDAEPRIKNVHSNFDAFVVHTFY